VLNDIYICCFSFTCRVLFPFFPSNNYLVRLSSSQFIFIGSGAFINESL